MQCNQHEPLGIVAGELLHEICNAFTVVKYQADQALNTSQIPESAQRALVSASEASARILTITESLLASVRRERSTSSSCEVSEVLTDVVHAFKTAAEIQLDVPPRLHVAVSPFVLAHILNNLIANAMAVIPRAAGRVEISARVLCKSDLASFTWNTSSHAVEVVVSDNGHGKMSGQDSSASSKRFGLAVCKRLLSTVGGTLILTPNSTRGVSARILVPQVDTTATLPSAA